MQLLASKTYNHRFPCFYFYDASIGIHILYHDALIFATWIRLYGSVFQSGCRNWGREVDKYSMNERIRRSSHPCATFSVFITLSSHTWLANRSDRHLIGCFIAASVCFVSPEPSSSLTERGGIAGIGHRARGGWDGESRRRRAWRFKSFKL